MADVTVERGPPGHRTSLSGLTEDEAKAFSSAFTMYFLGFLVIAIIAHFLVWQWRPWIPGTAGYEVSAVIDAVRAAGSAFTML